MLNYKILIKLFVLNCVFACCLYDGTIQVEVVVLCLLLSRDQQKQLYGTVRVCHCKCGRLYGPEPKQRETPEHSV